MLYSGKGRVSTCFFLNHSSKTLFPRSPGSDPRDLYGCYKVVANSVVLFAEREQGEGRRLWAGYGEKRAANAEVDAAANHRWSSRPAGTHFFGKASAVHVLGLAGQVHFQIIDTR